MILRSSNQYFCEFGHGIILKKKWAFSNNNYAMQMY